MAARSKITIWNAALTHVGAKNDVEADTETTHEVSILNRVWDLTYEGMLEAFDWPFARRYRALALLTEDPPDNTWTYLYSRPSDCLVARYIVPSERIDADPVPFAQGYTAEETRVIFTDAEDAVLVYTWRNTDPNQWSAAFCDAVSWQLAVELGMAKLGSPHVADMAAKEARRSWLRAMTIAAASEQADPARDPAVIRERQ